MVIRTRNAACVYSAAAALFLCVCAAGGFRISDCDNTSVGFTPVNDLGTGLYLDQFQGGLYPDGLNNPPPEHRDEGLRRAKAIEPLDADGLPDPNGKYVLISIGMSNTSQEFCCGDWTFMGQAAVHPDVNHSQLAIVNGAQGGRPAAAWTSPQDETYDRVQQRLSAAGLTEAQVVAVWLKQANPGPRNSLPHENADAYILLQHLGDIARAAKIRYPNLQMIFLSSRIYAGYASTQLNPEPYAYESAFSVKWLIEAQINQMAGGGIDHRAGDLNYNNGTAPWLGWAAYLWADGLVPRSDGLIWECADFQSDGTHPSQSGEEKVGTMLLDFFLSSKFASPWFRDDGGGGGGGDIAHIRNFQIVVGTPLGGTVDDLTRSDDSYVHTRSGFGDTFTEAHLMRMLIGAHSAVDNPRSMDITIESRIDEPDGRAMLSLRNVGTGEFDRVGSFPIGLTEQTVTIEDIGAADYVGTDGRIMLAIDHVVFVPFLAFTFESFIDLVEVLVQ